MSHPIGKPRAFDPWHRLSGVALLAASCGSSLPHRHVAQLPQSDAGDILQMALVLTGMILASVGILLLIFGARLFLDERDPCRFEGQPVRIVDRPAPHRNGLSAEGERTALATFLAHRAEAIAAARRQKG
jgi:hypothetical protein